MMSGNLVGEYLGRQLWVSSSFDAVDELSSGSLSGAMVLIWLSQESLLKTLLPKLSILVAANPLGIFFSGSSAERAFDFLLWSLQSILPTDQIMTRWSEDTLDECIAEFIQTVWPSEDRMDSWTTYWLVGDSRISLAAMTFLEKSGARDGL